MSSADRDRAYLAARGNGAETISPRFAPVPHSTRQQLGRAVAAARELARLSRSDLATALGVEEQRIADFESGSVPLMRGT